MDQHIEVDDQEPASKDDEPTDEGIPRTSSEPEHSEVSKHSTRSITRSLVEEHFENGRRYCSEDYYMPNDEPEQTRLAIAHQAYMPALDDQLTWGLIPRSAKRILDIGTGTGDWATAIAERFPNAEIIATDITNAFQPPSAPLNVYFELDDAQNEWAYNEPFDFIHMRNLSGAFANWGAVYAEVSKNLKPGGSFEIADPGPIQYKRETSNSNTSIFNGAIRSAADMSGRPLDLDHLKKPMFDNAGLSVAKTRVFEIPLGTYDPDPRKKLTGKMAMIAVLEGLEAVSLRLLTKHLGWKEEDVRGLCRKVQEEVMRPDARAFIRVQFVIARKLM
ncbi:hypothetical protein HO133_000459 [Letharia lupina]|uniref:Methyltransferase n=1 Tax=Letharia lupina TaxID=560253 RepID=A0A8H6CI13_9LECA|nr:uncharacterized protein HO133_000459 [Letharia lupina]KAF6223616.1 hypothetical protein HO133_000459 [Letharia lupina]